MNTTELRQKDADGVATEVKALQKAHFGLRMQKGIPATPERCPEKWFLRASHYPGHMSKTHMF